MYEEFNALFILIIVGNQGVLCWNKNWVTFLDTMLQMSVLRLPGKGLRLPTRIKSVYIDPTCHDDCGRVVNDETKGWYFHFCYFISIAL